MPLYEYENMKNGRIVEMSRPMRLRDDCPPHLKRVVSRTARPKIGKGLPDPSEADQAVPRALRELEKTMPTSEIERQSGFSAKQLKRVWNTQTIVALLLFAVLALSASAAEIVRGTTLTDGQQLYASDLHSLIDNSTIGVQFFNDQPTTPTVSGGFYFLTLDPANQVYRRVTAQTLLYGNTNYFLNVPARTAPSYGTVMFYDPTNNWLGTATLSNLLFLQSSNLNAAAFKFVRTNAAAGSNQYVLPAWPYAPLSAFNTNEPANLIAFDTNGAPYQLTLSNVTAATAADLGTNLFLPYQFTNTFLPWLVYGTNAATNAWGVYTNFPITALYMSNNAAALVTNTATLLDADTIPVNAAGQSTNTTTTLGGIYQYLTNKNALPAYALARVQFVGINSTVNVTNGSTLTYQFMATNHGMNGIKAVSWQFSGTSATTLPTTPQVVSNVCYYALVLNSSNFVLFTNYVDAVNSNNPVHISGTVSTTSGQNTLIYLNEYTAYNADAIQLCTGASIRAGYYDICFRTNLTTANYYFTGSMMGQSDSYAGFFGISADNIITTNKLRLYALWSGLGYQAPTRAEVLIQPQ